MPRKSDIGRAPAWRAPARQHRGPEATLRESLTRLAAFFQGRETRQGILARRLLGHSDARDRVAAEQLIRERRRQTRMDGSVKASLLWTAWAGWEFMDLGCALTDAPVVRTLGYALAQQDRAGHFAEGCDEGRHARRLCNHFLQGFFSPGARDVPIAPLTFPSGVVVVGEEDARFAVSCLALRVALRAHHEERPFVQRHIESLLELPGLWDTWNEDWIPDLAFFALGALGLAPPRFAPRLEAIVGQLVRHRRPDGSWPDAHLFHTLDTLLSVPVPAAQAAVRHAAPLLSTLQRENGGFDDGDDEERALIALRVLKMAVGGPR